MMKLRFLFLFILSAILMFSLSACLKEKVVNRPVDQPYSKWISEDETIYFETNENGAGYGTLKTSDGSIDIYFATGRAKVIDIYRMVGGKPNGLIERWEGDFKKDYMFIAVVSEKTTYYQKNEKITFYRVDDDVSLS